MQFDVLAYPKLLFDVLLIEFEVSRCLSVRFCFVVIIITIIVIIIIVVRIKSSWRFLIASYDSMSPRFTRRLLHLGRHEHQIQAVQSQVILKPPLSRLCSCGGAALNTLSHQPSRPPRLQPPPASRRVATSGEISMRDPFRNLPRRGTSGRTPSEQNRQ